MLSEMPVIGLAADNGHFLSFGVIGNRQSQDNVNDTVSMMISGYSLFPVAANKTSRFNDTSVSMHFAVIKCTIQFLQFFRCQFNVP